MLKIKDLSMDWIHLTQAGSYEYENEPSVSMKGGEFFDQLSF
jgi:hypothetical protein